MNLYRAPGAEFVAAYTDSAPGNVRCHSIFCANDNTRLHHVLLAGACFAKAERASGWILANSSAFTDLLVTWDPG